MLLISAGAFEGIFEGKTHREIPQGVLILHVNVPARRALAIQKKLAYPILRIWPRRTTTCTLECRSN